MIQFTPSAHPWAVTPENVSAVVALLVAVASPLSLIAFGSAAQGDLAAANDLDLLVVEPEVRSRYGETVRLHRALRRHSDSCRSDRYQHGQLRGAIPGAGSIEHVARTEGRVLHDGI